MMGRGSGDLHGNCGIFAALVAGLPLVVLVSCAPAPAPSAYYVAHPSTVVVMPSQEPATTTHYVYGEIHSTNETHITSQSSVNITSNHPIGGVAPPPYVPPGNVTPSPAVDQQVAEPAAPEEQTPREEPADETPSAEPDPEPAAEPAAEPEPPQDEPPPEPSSSDSDNSDK